MQLEGWWSGQIDARAIRQIGDQNCLEQNPHLASVPQSGLCQVGQHLCQTDQKSSQTLHFQWQIIERPFDKIRIIPARRSIFDALHDKNFVDKPSNQPGTTRRKHWLSVKAAVGMSIEKIQTLTPTPTWCHGLGRIVLAGGVRPFTSTIATTTTWI